MLNSILTKLMILNFNCFAFYLIFFYRSPINYIVDLFFNFNANSDGYFLILYGKREETSSEKEERELKEKQESKLKFKYKLARYKELKKSEIIEYKYDNSNKL